MCSDMSKGFSLATRSEIRNLLNVMCVCVFGGKNTCNAFSQAIHILWLINIIPLE